VADRLRGHNEITTANLIQMAIEVYNDAKAAKQYSARSQRYGKRLAGERVERAEKGEPGQFDKLSTEELETMLRREIERPMVSRRDPTPAVVPIAK
jgi:hypothetical protein